MQFIRISFIAIFILFAGFISGQNLEIGLPAHEHYDYEINGFQSVSHDNKNALIISANNQVIQFNGYYDPLIMNVEDIKAIEIKDSIIYYGGNKRFGTIQLDSTTNYALTEKFNQTESEVTHISSSNYGDFILSKNTVFHFTNDIAKKYSFPGIVNYLGSVNGSTIVHDDTNGLSIFVGGRFKLVNNSRFLSSMKVIAIKSTGTGSYIVATEQNGVYRFDGETFAKFGGKYLDVKRIIDLEVISSEHTPEQIVIITDDNSFLTFNYAGNLLHDKLFSSNLYALHKDNDERLFVINSKGIDVFFYNLPYQIVDLSVDPLHGPLVIFNEKLYWGTNNGLYYSRIMETNNLSDARVRVKDTEGKVGKLNIVNNTLLMSHEDGLYDVLPKIGARFIPDERFYDFRELENDLLLGFSNRNAYLLKKIRNKWRVQKNLDAFPIHPKSIVYNNKTLWLVDRDYTLIQYYFDEQTNSFEEKRKERNPDKIDIFSLNGELILIKERKAYTYNGDDFIPSEDLSALFGDEIELEQIINDQYGNIWFIQDHKVGIFNSSVINNKRTYKKLLIDYPNEDPRSIYPYDKNNVFINNGDHIVKLDLEKYKKTALKDVSINRIYTIKNDNVKNLYIAKKASPLKKSIRIQPRDQMSIIYSAPLFPGRELSYSLSNNDGEVVKINSQKLSKITLGDLTETEYNLSTQLSDYRGSTNSQVLEIDVRKNFFSTKYFYTLLGIVNILIIALAYVLGHRRGKRKATVVI